MITTNNKTFYQKMKSLRNLSFGKINRFNHDAKKVTQKLNKLGIGTRPFFWPMHRQKILKNLKLQTLNYLRILNIFQNMDFICHLVFL